MKKKTKIKLATITLAILPLTMIAPQSMPQEPSQIPEVSPVSSLVADSRDNTPSPPVECQIQQKLPMKNDQNRTHNQPISEVVTEPPAVEPIPTRDSSTQTTEKETTDITTISDTQTATKPTTPPPLEPTTSKMGDTRIINGQKQSCFLGFGWVDDMGENEVIYCDGMYENGNKIGIMGSDGDINKMVGIMD